MLDRKTILECEIRALEDKLVFYSLPKLWKLEQALKQAIERKYRIIEKGE